VKSAAETAAGAAAEVLPFYKYNLRGRAQNNKCIAGLNEYAQ
jgi:hypothetical protein